MMTKSKLTELLKEKVKREIARKRDRRLTDRELAAIIANTVNGLMKKAA